MPLCCLDRLTPRYLVSRSLSLAIKFPDLSVLVSKCLIFSIYLFSFVYTVQGWVRYWQQRWGIVLWYWMVLWARWSSLTTSQKSSSEVSLHPSISPSCFDFVSVHGFISFLSGLLPIQVKSSRIIPRVSKATMIYSVSLNLMSSMRYTRYVLKMGTCSAHALLLIDAYIVTIWPHSLPVNVLFVSTSLLIVSFSLEILWSRSWFCRNQHLQWNQCIPGWLWDRASGEGLSLTHSLSQMQSQFLQL